MELEVKDIITRDPITISTVEQARRLGQVSSPVLITGKTGSPREALARLIHSSGSRESLPFVVHSLPSDGADIKGLPESAGGGTLFIDGIDKVDLILQERLLSVLRSGNPLSTRIIGASESRDLSGDLLYFLSVNVIDISPLSERPQDIEPMACHFLEKIRLTKGFPTKGFDRKVMDIFLSYSWPGNEKEMLSVIEGALNLATGEFISEKDLPGHLTEEAGKETPLQEVFIYDENLSYQENLDAVERRFLSGELARFPSKKDVAEHFGMSRQALNYRLNKLGLKN